MLFVKCFIDVWAICSGPAIRICSFPRVGLFAVLKFASSGIVKADSNTATQISVPASEATQ